jgi:hypothetical protein
MVVNHGFSQINNPCKHRIGSHSPWCTSVTTGFYIGGPVVAVCRESTLDYVKILQHSSMTVCLLESQIRLDGNVFYGIVDMDALIRKWTGGVSESGHPF